MTDEINRRPRYFITGSFRLERVQPGTEFDRAFPFEEARIILSGRGRRQLIPKGDFEWDFYNEILTRCEQQDSETEPAWLISLRKEAWMAAMKDCFWLSRDQVFHLINAIPVERSKLLMSDDVIAKMPTVHYPTSLFNFLPEGHYPWKASTTRC